MINIEEMKKRCHESDPSLAVYMVRDTPEVNDAGLSDLAWVLCNGCHKNDALGFFELLEAHLTKRAPDAGESAPSMDILQSPALSASQSESTPPQRG